MRAAWQVNEKMQVLDKAGGKVVPGLWCIGDANGKMMLAHAASAQVRPAPVIRTGRWRCSMRSGQWFGDGCGQKIAPATLLGGSTRIAGVHIC